MTIVFIVIAILGFREFVGFTHVSAGDKSTNDNVVESVGETIQPELYDKEFGEWDSKMNAMLSEPMDDSKLKETNNDEGFKFKAQDVIREFPKQLIKESKEIEKEFSNLFLLSSFI